MRSPGPAFDLRAAIVAEVRAAQEELGAGPIGPQAAHRCRVRLKRARALARIGRANAPGLASLFNQAARALMLELAPLRELAALAEAARQASHAEKGKPAAALARAALVFDEAVSVLPATDHALLSAGLSDLLALAQVWPDASPRQIARGARRLARSARKLRRVGVDCLEHRHEWRKREKERLYGAEILGKAWPLRRRRRIARELCEALGRERDARLLLRRLREQHASKRAVKALRRRRRALRRRIARFAQRMGAA